MNRLTGFPSASSSSTSSSEKTPPTANTTPERPAPGTPESLSGQSRRDRFRSTPTRGTTRFMRREVATDGSPTRLNAPTRPGTPDRSLRPKRPGTPERQLSRTTRSTRLPNSPARLAASKAVQAKRRPPALNVEPLPELVGLPGARTDRHEHLRTRVNDAIDAYGQRAREAEALLDGTGSTKSAPSLGQLIDANHRLQVALQVLLDNSRGYRSTVFPSHWGRLRSLRQAAREALRELTRQGDFLAQEADILPKEIAAHCAARVPINHATRKMPLNDGMLRQQLVPQIESGRLHAVQVLSYRVPDGAGGEHDKLMVFKAEPSPTAGGGPDAAGPMGIDPKRPNYAGRAVATHCVDRALGLGLVPTTHFCIHDGQIGVAMAHVEHEAAQSKAPARVTLPADVADVLRNRPEQLSAYAAAKGFRHVAIDGNTVVFTATRMAQDPLDDDGQVEVPAEVMRPIDFNDPMLRRDLCDLNLLANLTGQCDLHLGNYGVRPPGDGGPRRLVAFDNDVSFGNAGDSARLYRRPDGSELHASKATDLPPVIARDTYNAVMAMEPERLSQLLDGLVTPEEIDATQDRLKEIKGHLSGLLADDNVLDDDGWNDPRVSDLLGLSLIENARGDASALESLRPHMERRNMVARDAWVLARTEATDPVLSESPYFDSEVVKNQLIDLAHDLDA